MSMAVADAGDVIVQTKSLGFEWFKQMSKVADLTDCKAQV